MFLDLLGAYGSYRANKAQAKAQRKMQKYRNTMTNLANAINQNSITQNETNTIQQSARQSVYQRKDEMSAKGAAVVAAAAAGVGGNSVNQTVIGIQRDAALIDKQRTDDLDQFFLQTHQQRLGSSFAAAQNQDLSYIPKPRLSTYLFGAVAENIDQATAMFTGMDPGTRKPFEQNKNGTPTVDIQWR